MFFCRNSSGALALLVVGAWTGIAAAQPLRVNLSYEVDPALDGCPTEAEFSAAVKEQLGYDPFELEAKHRVRAKIAALSQGLEGNVEWLNADKQSEGERRLSSPNPDCQAFARGLSFAIAVQIQLRNSADPPKPKPAEPTQAPPVDAKPRRPAKRPAAPRVWVAVGLGPTLQHGFQPKLGVGARLFGLIRAHRWSLELGTEASFPVELRLSDGSGFSSNTLVAKLVPCFHVAQLGFCGVGMLGQLHVRGFGVDQVGSPSSFIGAAGARLGLFQPILGWLGGMLHGDVLFPLTQRTVLLNRQRVWTTDPLSFSAGIDLAAVFQ